MNDDHELRNALDARSSAATAMTTARCPLLAAIHARQNGAASQPLGPAPDDSPRVVLDPVAESRRIQGIPDPPSSPAAPDAAFAPGRQPGSPPAAESDRRALSRRKRERADARTANGHKLDCEFEAKLDVGEYGSVPAAPPSTVGALVRLAVNRAMSATQGITPKAWEAYRGKPSTDSDVVDLLRAVPCHEYRDDNGNGYDWIRDPSPAFVLVVVDGRLGEPLEGQALIGVVRECFKIPSHETTPSGGPVPPSPPKPKRDRPVDDRHASMPTGGWTRASLVARAGELLGEDGSPSSLILCNSCNALRTTACHPCPACRGPEYRFYASELKNLTPSDADAKPIRMPRRKRTEVPGVDEDRG